MTYLLSKKGKMAALLAITVLAFVLIATLAHKETAPYLLITSADASSVIYQLPKNTKKLFEISTAQKNHSITKTNESQALVLSQQALEAYQNTAKSRYLRIAKSALQPWWHDEKPSAALWLLRGRILQTQHKFEEAAIDLTTLSANYPQLSEARLLATDAWRRAGQLTKAKKACFAVALSARPLLAQFCAVEILLTAGDYDNANRLVEKALANLAFLSNSEQRWAQAIYADTLLATGDINGAAQVWLTITADNNTALSYKLAYADVLLTLSRPQEAIHILEETGTAMPVLLRRAAAAKALNDPGFKSMTRSLNTQFNFTKKTAEANLHLREQALYFLWIEDDAEQALRLATKNWKFQKGWEDAELVLNIAKKIGDRSSIKRINDWREAQR
ncbi:MAG: hypothetical protein JKY66_03510 [Spongiibacteraceae bacterium]|nr:hypothetical protein [Spongiibacteraceae bacterium]